MGVPTVALVTRSFVDQCSSLKYVSGFPTQRLYFSPHPITGVPADICAEYLRGNDPITGRPLFTEIVEGLTVADPDDQKTGLLEFPRAETIGPDTPDNLENFFMEKKWTDFMPIHLPTSSRVNDMLAGTSHNRDEVVGKMRSTGYWRYREYTVEQIACNAVMAGCKPEYLPVVLAIAGTQSCHTSTSTTSFSSMLVINGPIRNEIGMNYKIGALGPYNHANSTIGRSWTIISKCQTNIGRAGEAYMGTQGNPLNYNNICFPENEERLPPGWNPLHVQRGFQPNESTVTTFSGWSHTFADQSFEWELLPQIPWWFALWSLAFGFGNRTALFDPDIAWRLYNESGVSSKEEVSDYVAENATVLAWDYWNRSYGVQNFIRPGAVLGREPSATWLTYADDEPIKYLAGGVNIVVVGGETNQFWQLAAQNPTRTVSVDDWR